MNRIKKILSLLLFVVLINSKTIAQQAANDSKININQFSVTCKDQKIMVDWATDGITPTNYLEIQQSTDGINFSSIAFVLGPDPRQKGDHYQYADKWKASKLNTIAYRLKHVNTDGTEIFSQIIYMTK